ncbi:hypothetical protein [uncultured Alistipes sp.]|uniref:hypothetical protein n=1 Tax=uncultured Alistipes sp. TaxID=538949 RepID=UPI002632050D|nr:hypothetical protein [uncultured Alistipes sp.]
MAVVRERIILRKGRRNGEKKPHRIDIKELSEGDSLLVEITIDKEKDLVYRCLFEPEQLAGRRSVAFRVIGEEVYWLSNLQPKPLLKQQADRLVPAVEHVEEVSSQRRGGKQGSKERKILVFDEKGNLVSIYVSLQNAATMMNLRETAIDKLCKTKRSSFETGYYFRYWWKVLHFDITDFSMTVRQYDLLCSRNERLRLLSGLL